MAIPTLTTGRLVLRPFVHADLDQLAALHSEESFWWYPLRRGMNPQETAAFLNRTIERYGSDGFGVEAAIDKESGSMIGWAGLAVPHFLPEVLPAVEAGWRLARRYWGRGLATEAGEAAVGWGFTLGALDRLVSIYEPENAASGRVMERLGFTPTLSTAHPERGETLIVTELTRTDWQERRAHG